MDIIFFSRRMLSHQVKLAYVRIKKNDKRSENDWERGKSCQFYHIYFVRLVTKVQNCN